MYVLCVGLVDTNHIMGMARQGSQPASQPVPVADSFLCIDRGSLGGAGGGVSYREDG